MAAHSEHSLDADSRRSGGVGAALPAASGSGPLLWQYVPHMYGRGGVNFAQFHVKMDAVEITDPAVLNSLRHPESLNSAVKKTCTAAMGVSFGAGAEDGPGPTVEGASCNARTDPARLTRDLAALAAGKLPPEVLATAVLCNLNDLPFDAIPVGTSLSCQAEKPVLSARKPPKPPKTPAP